MYRHVLIATDGSELSNHAAEHGGQLARALGAKITLLTVTAPFHIFSLEADQLEDTRPEYERHMRERASRILAAARHAISGANVPYDEIHREGDRPDEIIQQVADAKRCDLIVMGSHGRRGVSAVLLGSVTMKVLAQTRTPVLVVR